VTLPVIVPAAGLGLRLAPLTDFMPKEMLPFQGDPIILTTLKECANAGVSELIVVLGPHKGQLRDYLANQAGRWPFPISTAEQPEPRGVIDAVDRGRSMIGGGSSYAVVFPDFIHRPGHTALAQLCAAHARVGGTVTALTTVTAESAPRLGRTARIVSTPTENGVHRIERLESSAGAVAGTTQQAFAELRDAHHAEVVEQLSGTDEYQLNMQVLNTLAAEGALHGVMVEGELLDTGIRAGYDHALAG